jgi:hypothetical protein
MSNSGSKVVLSTNFKKDIFEKIDCLQVLRQWRGGSMAPYPWTRIQPRPGVVSSGRQI